MKKKKVFYRSLLMLGATSVALIFSPGCGGGGGKSAKEDKTVIQNAGSDTMVNLVQAWAEAYVTVDATVSVEVSGGGSGTGIAALINGTTDIANCSRSMKASEIHKAKANTNKDPKKHIVGMDALAVYVHKDNPLNEITIGQLGQIFGEDGGITKWSQLGIEAPGGKNEIIRISRQSNSGTYVYFKETVVAKGKEFKQGSLDLHGSKDVVELVGKTPSAIGYSGMGYATDHVKMLKVAQEDGAEAHEPSMENAMSKKYPIARPLFMYTLGTPEGAVKTYIDWCLGAEGQKVVVDNGYIPVIQ
jgi:phosphate transport system substrate-binding protein